MKGSRIMIVEDELLVARDLQIQLRGLGYQADWVSNSGEDAVKVALECQPQLLLMDIRLGNGMDGIETVARIHKASDVPVVYLTGYSDKSSFVRARDAEAYGYISKPVDTTELYNIIEIAMRRHGLQRLLNDSNRRLQVTLASIADGVIATDSSGRITLANRVATSILGRPSGEIIGAMLQSAFIVRLDNHSTELPGKLELTANLLDRKQDHITYSDALLLCKNSETPIELTAQMIIDEENTSAGIVLVFRDITARKAAERDLRHRAYYDFLTDLPNRSLFHDRMHWAIAQSNRNERILALLFLDLDDFKTVNDRFGHDAGDELLRQLAGRLQSHVRGADTVARLAGDEFVIILTDVSAPADAERIAEKILRGLDPSFELMGTDVQISASIGIALFPEHGIEMESLLRYADTAMYLAKQKGKNAYAVYSAEWKNDLPEDIKDAKCEDTYR